MKKWTKKLAICGQVIGILIGATQDYNWSQDVSGFLRLLGYGIPYAAIGGFIGLTIDYINKKIK